MNIFFDDDKTYIDDKGYRRFRSSGKLVHRWAAEKKIGRKLKKEEVVHHIDRNKLNNSPGNLWVCANREEHERIHRIDARRHGAKASYKGFGKRRAKTSPGCTMLLTAALLVILFLLY